MSILESRDKLEVISETASHLKCTCPVCGGSRLKIALSSRAYGAYKCYDNYCDPKSIRDALGIKTSKNYYLSPYKPAKQISPYENKKLIKNIETAKPVTLQATEQLIRLSNYTPLKSSTKNFRGGISKTTTIYPYSEHQRIYRLDSTNTKKQIYIQYLAGDGVTWELGMGESRWPLYEYGIQDDLRNQPGNAILMVEGEKTCEYVKTQLGLACITAVTPYFTYQYLEKAFYIFTHRYPNIKKIVYVPDHDAPGYSKAEKVRQAAWYSKLACDVVTVKDFIQLSFEPEDGSDLADFNLSPNDHSVIIDSEKCPTLI